MAVGVNRGLGSGLPVNAVITNGSPYHFNTPLSRAERTPEVAAVSGVYRESRGEVKTLPGIPRTNLSQASTAVPDERPDVPCQGGQGGYSSYREISRHFSFKSPSKPCKNRHQKADEHREKQKTAIIITLRKANLDYYADELQNCATEFVAFRCGLCGEMFGHPRTCHLRICPRCANARASRLAEKYEDRCKELPNPRHLVLTFRSVKHIDADYIRWCFDCFVKLAHRKFWKRLTYGAIVAFEVTYGANGFHPHLHVYVSSKVGRLPIELIRSAWQSITGANWCRILPVIIDWRRAMSEVVKYPLKIADFYDEPKAFAEYVGVIDGVRLVRGYGAFYRLAEKFKPSGKLSEIPCPRCGQTGFVEKIASYQPACDFKRAPWGWQYLPNAPP